MQKLTVEEFRDLQRTHIYQSIASTAVQNSADSLIPFQNAENLPGPILHQISGGVLGRYGLFEASKHIEIYTELIENYPELAGLTFDLPKSRGDVVLQPADVIAANNFLKSINNVLMAHMMVPIPRVIQIIKEFDTYFNLEYSKDLNFDSFYVQYLFYQGKSDNEKIALVLDRLNATLPEYISFLENIVSPLPPEILRFNSLSVVFNYLNFIDLLIKYVKY